MAGYDGVMPESVPPTFDDIPPSMYDATARLQMMDEQDGETEQWADQLIETIDDAALYAGVGVETIEQSAVALDDEQVRGCPTIESLSDGLGRHQERVEVAPRRVSGQAEPRRVDRQVAREDEGRAPLARAPRLLGTLPPPRSCRAPEGLTKKKCVVEHCASVPHDGCHAAIIGLSEPRGAPQKLACLLWERRSRHESLPLATLEHR